jgi:hypothetical protein
VIRKKEPPESRWSTLKVVAVFLLAALAMMAIQMAANRAHQTAQSVLGGR